MTTHKKSGQKTIIIGLAIALLLVFVGVIFFSYSMETLDQQAEQLGAQEQTIYQPPFPDYAIPGLDNTWSALIIGIVSTLLLFIVSVGVAKILRRKKST